jgi:hypothetical protein
VRKQAIILTDEIVPPPALVRAGLDALPAGSRVRDCDAICPADPLLVYALEKLGFARIHPVQTMGPISSGDFELYPTKSETAVREFGMIRSGMFWNQVDSSLSAATIEVVAERFEHVDLLSAMYASQNFEFFESQVTSFPFETHRQNLGMVLRISPRMVAPGSAGFRFCGDHAWLNRTSRRKFRTGLDGLSLLPRTVQETSATRISPSGVTAIPCGAISWPWPSPCPLSQSRACNLPSSE